MYEVTINLCSAIKLYTTTNQVDKHIIIVIDILYYMTLIIL